MTTLNENQLLEQLSYFNGTSQYYYNSLFKAINYTDGIKYVTAECDAYWLLTDVLSTLLHKLRKEEFVTITLKVKDGKGNLIFDDGNDNILHKINYNYTDFPLKEIIFFFENNVLYLPSER